MINKFYTKTGSAMADVEARIDSGEINENARKAINDKLNK